jgi:hypothetical protein
MTNRERVIEYLRSISPRTATNADICSGTRISPHPQVFQITRELLRAGMISGRQLGREWHFGIAAGEQTAAILPTSVTSQALLHDTGMGSSLRSSNNSPGMR